MKKIIGIVAEYNPFHAGHAGHIHQSRLAAGDDDSVVMCVMSGDFVQRGEWAMQPKAVRAAQAVQYGADLVFELPLPWCLASAGIFTSGAVQMLLALGMTHLSFGSESGDLKTLSIAAEVMAGQGFEQAVAAAVKADPRLTYPAAMSRVLGNDVISTPNDLLAVSYLCELIKNRERSGRSAEAICIRRTGNRHDAPEAYTGEEENTPSASQIRNAVYSGRMDLPHADRKVLSVAAMSRLRMFDKEYFNTLPDCANGLGNRIYDAVRETVSLEEVFDMAKTRAYTHSRVRRSVMCAVLGIREGDSSGVPPYARVLATNEKGMAYLASIKETAEIPVINRPKEVSFLGEHARQLFTLGSAAHDFYTLGYTDNCIQRCGEDYRTTPFVVQN